MHLFHPAVVHFSVALIVLGGLVEVWGLLRQSDVATRFGERLLVLGGISLLPALFTGYLAANSLDVGAAAKPLLDAHERNAWILLGLLVVALFWKGWFRGRLPAAQQRLFALLLLLIVGLTVWSAVLGGDMVYGHGVGVAAR